MRFCRYDDNRLGVVVGDQVKDVTSVLDRLPNYRYPFPHGDQFMAHFAELRPVMEEMAKTAPSKPLADVALLSPIANPGKIVGAPVNYRLHLDEVLDSDQLHHGMKIKPIAEAGVFLKAVSSLIGPSEGVVVDWADRRTDHEIELAVIIGKKAFVCRRRMRWITSPVTRSVTTSPSAARKSAATASRSTRSACSAPMW